jgi:RNA polymerase sigma-70 factor (ECF subfamily)
MAMPDRTAAPRNKGIWPGRGLSGLDGFGADRIETVRLESDKLEKPKAVNPRDGAPLHPEGLSAQAGQSGRMAATPGAGPAAHAGTRQALGAGARVEADATDWSEIVRRCLSGESPAWTELVRTHHRRVYSLCYRFTGSGTDAEDLTQDVFLKIYANLASFDTSRGSLQVWITTLTRNLLVDHFRRTRNLRATGSLDEGWDLGGEDRPMIPADRLEAKGPTQHDQATRRELEKMVQQALAQVSPELREAVILRDLQDMDYKEIASVLSIPEGTVKSRISRGRAELARLLERNKREVM